MGDIKLQISSREESCNPAGLGSVRIDYLEASGRGALLTLEDLRGGGIKKMGEFCQVKKQNHYSLNTSKGNIIF